MPPFYVDNLDPDRPEDSDGSPPATEFTSFGYERALIEQVWEYAEVISGNDPALWRKDEFGAWIHRPDYGRRRSEFGWEICDLSAARGAGGLAALRPMQWQNYVDQVAALTQSRITADGLHNARKLI
jgi:hypothetical protein